MGMELLDLTAAEFADRRSWMVTTYAASVTENFGVPPEQALAGAEQQLAAMLPDGVASPGHLLRRAVDDGVEVGFLWISLPGTTFPDMAWLSEIEVAAAHRSRGYGTRMIAAGEDDLRARGVGRIGLHVFGRNDGARRLYERLGYRILRQVRARPVGTPPPSPVTLVPAAPDETCAAHAGGRPVGLVRFGLPTAQRPTVGEVVHLEIEPELRRRGLGRQVLAAVEAELARRGVPRMGLTVPGEPAALAFAAALDMPVVSQQMVKDL